MIRSATYPMIEASFELSEVADNPFAVVVDAIMETPDATELRVPAFFDGGRTWKIRYTPRTPGKHRIDRIEIEGVVASSVENLSLAEFETGKETDDGFVEISPSNPKRFALSNGDPYFPIGHNAGWGGVEQYELYFPQMEAAGENWTRVWMCHWSKMNLDWVGDKDLSLGMYDLDVARTWDRIIQLAERHRLRLQFVLQHHGQFSSLVNAAWSHHPWNVDEGGFLEHPADFFVSDKAKALTRQKYRYVVARWGYSTSVMAWELFNEIEFTDAYIGKDASEMLGLVKSGDARVGEIAESALKAIRAHKWTPDGGFTLSNAISVLKSIGGECFSMGFAGGDIEALAAWHREMAEYIRSVDVHQHMVTTSSPPVESPLWEVMDFLPIHKYHPEMITQVNRLPEAAADIPKPVFYAEIGDHQMIKTDKADGRYTRAMLWAGMMSGASGAAQVWAWDRVEALGFYSHFKAVARFAELANFEATDYRPCDVAPLESGSSLLAMGLKAPRSLVLWVYHSTGVHQLDIDPVQAGFRIETAKSGDYCLDWRDTEHGDLIESQTISVGPDGEFIFFSPPISRDLIAIATPIAD